VPVIVLATAICELLLVAYLYLGLTGAFWYAVNGLMYTSMILVGVCAVVFPYSKRAKSIWVSSPFSQWKILGIPSVTVGGLIYVLSMGFIWTYYMIVPNYRSLTFNGLILYACIWSAGGLWYLLWRGIAKRKGVDVVALTLGQLPPE